MIPGEKKINLRMRCRQCGAIFDTEISNQVMKPMVLNRCKCGANISDVWYENFAEFPRMEY